MNYIRDKVIVYILLSILIYFIYRQVNYSVGNISYDHMLICYIIFCTWFVCCNYRSFVMTRRDLSSYRYDLPLEYKYNTINNKVHHVYVRVYGEDDWYKLDNLLTLSLPCSIIELDSFMKKNSSIHRLLSTMNDRALDNSKYFLFKSDYNIIRIVLLLFMFIIFFIYGLIYNKIQ